MIKPGLFTQDDIVMAGLYDMPLALNVAMKWSKRLPHQAPNVNARKQSSHPTQNKKEKPKLEITDWDQENHQQILKLMKAFLCLHFEQKWKC